MKRGFVLTICFWQFILFAGNLLAQTDSLLNEFEKISKTAKNIPRLIDLTKKLSVYNIDSALSCTENIKNIKIPDKDYKLRSRFLLLQGTLAKQKGSYDEANTYLRRVFEITENRNLISLQIITLYEIGDLNRAIGLLDVSLLYLYKSRNLAYKHKVNHKYPKIYDRLGSTFFQLADVIQGAVADFHEFDSINIPDQKDIPPGIKSAEDYSKLCKIYADSALMYSKQNNDINTTLSSLNLLGAYYRHKQQHTKAIDYLNRAVDLATKNNIPTDIPNYYGNIARSYLEQKEYDKAIEAGLKGYELADTLNILVYKSLLSHILFRTYKEIKDYDNVLKYNQLETDARNALYELHKWNQISELEKKYENKQKQKEIEHQKELLQLKNNEVVRLYIVVIVLLVVFVMIVAGIIYIQKQKKKITAQAKKINQQYKNLEKLDRFKETLTHSLVHDLKNPLSQILTNTDNLNVRYAANKMLRLIMNLLDVEKYESTDFVLNKEIHSLSDILGEVEKDHLLSLNEKNLKLQCNFSDYMISADREIIQRVFDNLLSNAIRFSPLNSSIDISITKSDNGNIEIGIKNYGQTIPGKELPYIFDKFRHYEKDNNSSHRSTGLGLTFCKMAIEAHGQKIFAQNEPDGVLFYFTLESKISNQQKQIQLPKEVEPETILSQDEINLLHPFLMELQSLEVYQITDIRRTINKIPDETENIIHLKNQIKNSVYASNNELYNNLLNLV